MFKRVLKYDRLSNTRCITNPYIIRLVNTNCLKKKKCILHIQYTNTINDSEMNPKSIIIEIITTIIQTRFRRNFKNTILRF